MNEIDLPLLDEDLKQNYHDLIKEIDRCVRELTEGRLASRVGCRPGCADCCIAFSVLPLEAALLAECLTRQPMRAVGTADCCVFLENDRCRLYALRPVICRTQGMALAYIDEEKQSVEVSACYLNFPEDAELDHDDLLFMDQFNARLADLNRIYCERHGLTADTRIALADLLPSS
jgi:Fe-S-cluster containining protein